MKNIFSKTTENRTQNGVKSYSFPTRLLSPILIFAFLTLGVGQMRGGASWIGNSFIVANGIWYNGSGSGQSAAFNNKALGTISSLTLGGEVQTYGQTDGAGNPARMHYQISGESASYITLNWLKWKNNNNYFQSLSNTIDISGLSAGDHTISVWFEQPDGNQWDSNNSNNYVANFTINPVVTFHANGGTGDDYTQTVTYNSATALTANTFSKTGYTFLGWSTTADGDVVYTDVASVTLTAHTDLYAKWAQQSLTITSYWTYLSETDKLTLGIDYANIPSGYCYRVKVGGGYYNNSSNQDRDAISGSGSTTFTSFSALPPGNHTVIVELWKDSPFQQQTVASGSVTVTVEQNYNIDVRAKTDDVENTAGGTVSSSFVRPTAHIGQTITAAANVGYDFTGWTATPENNITFENASELSTTVYATSGGTIYANFKKQSGSYSTTFYAGDHGSIRIIDTDIAKNGNASVTIGENETLSATPESAEYVFDHWETTGSVSVADIYSATTTVTATAAGGIVTAYYRHRPTLGAVTATPSGQYAEPPIDFELRVTSTYLPNPVVVFLVNDGETTYEVVGAPYGANGNDAAGTIGTGPVYTTVHKATFTASAAKTYTVSAKLYEGELIDNFEGENTRSWAGDNLENGSMTFANNPVKMTVNGSNKVMQVTRTGGKDWGGAIMLFVDKNAKATCDAAGSNDYAYIHARMKDATDDTHLKNNDNASDGNDNDILPSFDGETSSDWRHVTYHNTHCSNNFLFFMIQRGNTDDKTVYIDDIILSNEEKMKEKATAAAPASFSINTVTLNNNDATTPGTESVIVTYGSALSNITVPSKTDYTFYGYYTENAGEGRQLINDAGEWIASVDGYTNENKKWVHDGDVTLYAYYKKAEITRITFSPGNIVAPSATVTVTATIEPAPAGETTICWRVLYSNDNPLAPQPTFTPAEAQDNSVSFIAPETSGSYKVEATLRKGTSCGGEEIHTFTAPFQVAGDHTVTVQYKCGNTTIKASTSATGKPLEWTAITAPEIVGYSFLKWVEGDGITIEGATNGEKADATINFQAIYDGKLTAVYSKKNMIYFNNTLGWSDVYVYFYNSNEYWSGNYGSGAKKYQGFGEGESEHPYWEEEHGKMTRIEGTNIWYFDYTAVRYTTRLNVVFTEGDQHGNQWFHQTNVVRRGDHKSSLPMFVPLNTISDTKNECNYYNEGYWMNYPNYSGYTLKIYNTDNRNTEPTAIKSFDFPYSDAYVLPMSVDVDLEANKKYYFDVYRNDNTLFGNNGDMKYGNSGPWSFFNTDTRRAGITTTAAGNYRFTWSFFKESSTYNYHMTVTYPVAPNDYRVIYTDNATWTKAHTARTWYHPSRIISAEMIAKDTISFFVSKGHSPEYKIQRVNSINAETGAITWKDVTSWISCDDDVDASGVYNFIFTQYDFDHISCTKIEPYTGNFYIRTDAANSKWDNYRSDPDHLMTYSEYSITHGGYSHYYCHWVPIANAARKNIKFCIANDYSPCISDTLARETASGEWTNINSFIDEHGNLQRSSNVRFMWNQSTNKVSRAYLDPSTNDDNFLVLESADGRIANQNEIVQPSVVFSDNENWIYEANVKAKPNAQIKLKATWGDAPTIVQYFKGTESTTETLITGSTNNWYDIRLIYDFKTNRLIAAMLPSGNHTTIEPINADVMFIREHQGDIEQLTFTGDGALTDIKIAYGVMRFNKWTLNNREKIGDHIPLVSPASIYERAMYFISFPFEVKLSEVFGFGTYGQDWIIEYYDGAERARTGWWEGQPGFWRYVWDRKNFVLKPNVGYLLELELGNFKEGSGFWNNKNERLELFFPSSGNLGSITNTTVNCSIPEHACYINRHETEGLPDTPDNPRTSYNRTIFDSHWNVMGVPTYVNVNNPSFANTTWIADGSRPKFLYTWNPVDNTLTATSGKSFMYHAMHAYMVQYGGNVQWVTSGTKPAAIVARNTYAEEPKEVEFRLEIQQNEKMVDQTFVIMSNDDQINANFQFGEDMSKDFNARNANIYTMTADNVAAAGNSLPMSENTTIVPVGVSVKKTGDYTFSIPDGTNGIGVTLIDEETGIRTSLSALDYTVNLAAGDYTERFWLEISPIQNTPTGIEEPTSESSLKGRAQKRIIDGVLYIVKDGKIFDARGTRVE